MARPLVTDEIDVRREGTSPTAATRFRCAWSGMLCERSGLDAAQRRLAEDSK